MNSISENDTRLFKYLRHWAENNLDDMFLAIEFRGVSLPVFQDQINECLTDQTLFEMLVDRTSNIIT